MKMLLVSGVGVMLAFCGLSVPPSEANIAVPFDSANGLPPCGLLEEDACKSSCDRAEHTCYFWCQKPDANKAACRETCVARRDTCRASCRRARDTDCKR